VVSHGTVYVSTSSGTLWALSLATGQVVWNRSVGPDPTTADASGPLVLVGSAPDRLTALWAANGTVAWTSDLSGEPVQAVAVEDSVAYVATTAGSVQAVRASDGSTAWTTALGGPVSAGVSVDGPTVVAVGPNGTVDALGASAGTLEWTRALGSAVDSAPAVAGGLVVVGEADGVVAALSEANGSLDWQWDARTLVPLDGLSSTPSVGHGQVVVATDLGGVDALDASDGHLLWNSTGPYSGYPVDAGAVGAAGLVFAAAGATTLEALDRATGGLHWALARDGGSAIESPAAVVGQELVIGDDAGCVVDLGRPGGPAAWPVSGEVVAPNGTPVAGALVEAGGLSATTDASGTFELELTNGTYELYVVEPGSVPTEVAITVDGPLSDLVVLLAPIPLFELSGVVVDADSGRGVAGAFVNLTGPYGYQASAVTGPDGAFELLAGDGANELSITPPDGYASVGVLVTLDGAPERGVVLQVAPTGLAITDSDPGRLDVWLPIVLLALAAAGLAVADARARRRAAGLPEALLSRFGRYVAMRLLLIPGQVVAVLVILYAFGTFLPAAANGQALCSLAPNACAGCSWSSAGCVASAFAGGLGTFLVRLVTGDWGFASYGLLSEPATQFLVWWLPDSVELAIVALALSVAIAYPVSVWSSARPDSPVDVGSRLGSTLGLLVPSFLVLLAVFSVAYEPFVRALGDSPYGLTPTAAWLADHGGSPPWVGLAGTTSPTGFPIVDALWHHDWPYARLALAKTGLQACVIALIYVAIYLRFLRSAIARALTGPSVLAARARGLSERAILWRHAGRRLWPTYLIVFGSTIPAYIGAQALVEAISNDTGLGTLLLTELVEAPSTGFGFARGTAVTGNFYQVAIFLVVLLVLATRLAADIAARALDPRLLDSEGT
jgi:ABC-type dipeptide/oligopeptide/nickel transport system permease component/outer membrane protein assembly factor BamB